MIRINLAISGYLIMIEASNPTYYFSALKSYKALKINSKRYRGSEKTWDYWLSDSVLEDIRDITKRAEQNYSLDLNLGFFDDAQSARKVADWLKKNENSFSHKVVRLLGSTNVFLLRVQWK